MTLAGHPALLPQFTHPQVKTLIANSFSRLLLIDKAKLILHAETVSQWEVACRFTKWLRLGISHHPREGGR